MSPALGANVLQTFFVPLPEDQMQVSLNAIDAYRGYIGDEMESAISIVVGTDGTVIYYDHWEDGYEADITNPTQLTTQIWGDGDPGNGFPPGFPGDVLDAGDVVRLESTIDVTRNSVTIEYDGRDKISVTHPVAMTRAMYAVDPGEVLAEATGVMDISTHGTLYRAPVGVGTGSGFGTNELFNYTAFYIMADYDFTRIDLDKDNDGIFEETIYLDQGEPYFVNGGIVAGATVQGSQPFQCHLVTGDVGSTYEMRWYELWPESQWGTDYFTPVGTRTNQAGGIVPALVYLFNPNAETITVHFVTQTNSGSFTVDPNSVYDVFEMPLNSGARFTTTNGAPFLGVNVFDTSVSGGTLYGYVQHCQTYDWGIGLMPVNMMSTMGVVGWGPGYGTTGTGDNGNPIWISALTNTTIYVDYDADPDTGPLVDPLGNRYDIATNVTALELVQLIDPTDDDQTGMRYYTVDGAVLMAAWGQDPSRAGPGNPYLDMGYAIPAFPTVLSKKFASLLNDVNGNGYADSGDTIEYFVDVINVGFATANNVIFRDDLPTNLTIYVTNSAALASGGTTNAVPDSLPPKLTRFPFDEGGYNIGTIALGATTTIRYVTQVLTNLPSDFDGYIHNNATVSGTNGNWTGGWTVPVRVGGLSIEKETGTTNLLEPGTNFTYTVTVANTGTVTFTGIQIQDTLPLGVTYVSNSATIQISGGITNTLSDRFNLRSYTNSNGTIPWLSGWTEIGETDGVAGGGVQVLADVAPTVPLEAYALRVGNASRGATRQADLSGHASATLSFDYRRSGLDGPTDYVDVFISSNHWVSSNLLVRLEGAADETNRTVTNFNVSAYISTNTGIRLLSSATMGADDFVWFDNVTFTLVGTDATFAGEPPPTLAQNLTLPPGGTITATFDVTVDLPPVSTQVVNMARTRADQDSTWLDSNPVTNAINATEGMRMLKTTGTTNLLVAGTSVVYTIQISNTGTVAQTGIHLEDALPTGMTFVSAELYRPFPHTNEFLDVFNFQTYTNSDGNVAWTGPWIETGDDGSPTGGDIAIAVDGGSIPGQTYALRTAGTTATIRREANLAGYTTAVLWLDYRSSGLEAGEYLSVQVSANGGGSYTEVGQIGTDEDDGSYFPTNYTISAYASTGTVVRFSGGGGRGAADYVWVDNVRIAASAANATNALPPTPDLLEGYTLPPLTNMTVTVTASVNDPLEALEFLNTATLTSDQQTVPLVSSATNAAAGIVGMSIAKTSLLAGTWDLGETNTYEIVLENTGTVTQTGVVLTDLLPAGVTYVPGSVTITQSPPPAHSVEAFTSVGTTSFTAPADVSRVEVLVVGGGGGGGTGGTASRGGGGAGGIVHRTNYAVTGGGSYTVTVGGGGGAGTAGGNSVFDSLTGLGGGLGSSTHLGVGGNGGSGGGGSGWSDTAGGTGQQPGSASGGYGSNGGAARSGTTSGASGGGGGAGAVGATGSAASGGAGGAGLQYTNFTAYGSPGGWFGGGGGGGASTGTAAGGGGTGGGGNGGSGAVGGGGTANTGGGGGGSTSTGGSGGSGIVLVRYSQPAPVVVYSPPNLLSSATLRTGDVVTVRFAATLNVPLVSTQLINVATVTSDQQPSREASVTNVADANAVGDFVWFDADGDGIQDGGESGLAGVVVRLYDSTSNLLLTTTSGVTGAYAFTNLPNGSYFLEFVTPPDYLPTLQDQGGDDAVDSDIDTNGFTAVFALTGGTSDPTRDAGYYQPASSIGNFVWNDLDGDGVQDGGSETGMPGVVVTLYDASSTVVGVTTSSAAGAYGFTNLPVGNYFLGFTPPGGFTFTLQDQGGNDALDSDVSPVTGRTALFYLPPGVDDDTRDAGLAAIVYGLSITKTSDAVACVAPDDTITYTVIVVNTGNVSQVGVTIQDSLPPGLTYVPASAVMVVSQSVVQTTYVTNTVRDEFNAIAYTNQDGTANWANDWQEIGESNGAGANAVRVENNWGTNYQLRIYNVSRGAWRQVNLGGAVSATLSFDYRIVGFEVTDGEASYLSVSTNGGSTWITLETWTDNLGTTTSTNFNLSAYLSTNTAIAFTNNAVCAGGEGPQLDNVQIEYVTASTITNTTVTTNAAGAPPNLVTNLTLAAGGRVTVTFEATVDKPGTATQYLNTASTYSAVQPAIEASVTNCAVYADVGVFKFVTETEPDQAEIIDYWVVATNSGPDAASGLEITDLLPADVQYNSHSNGTYNLLSGIWEIGDLAVGASTTLYFNVTVFEGTGGKSITNTATITARELHDPNPSNDTHSVVIVPTGGAAVGDRVWFDTNRNGIQDLGETNQIADIPVALMSTNGLVVTSTVTSAEGLYLFENILPGTYYVRFDLTNVSTSVTLSPAGQGGDPALDSDVLYGATGNFAWTTNFTLVGGQTNLNVDLGLMLVSSTRATLAEVWGEGSGGAARIVWRTISEWNTAGFFVYRVDPETGAEERVNPQLLPSAMDAGGAIYELADPQAAKNRRGTYRIEEVELTGATLDLGRHDVVFGPPPASAKAARAEARAMAMAKAAPVKMGGQKFEGPSGILKAAWRKEGFYALRFEDLAAGLGLSREEVEALSASHGLRLTCGGEPLRTIHDEARGRLVFYGPPVDNWYARDNAAMISAGAGAAMPRRAPGASRGDARFPVTVRFEEDRNPFDSAAVMPEDFYYWDYVISGHATMGERSFPLDLSGADGAVGLRVRLQGWSSTTNDPDHLAEFHLNGEFLGSLAFDGQDAAEAELLVPAAWVLDGTNTLTVKGVLQAGRTHSFFVVDRVDASFDRWISPVDGTAHFRPGRATAARAPAFDHPLVAALDAEGRPTWISADGEGHLPGKAWAVQPQDVRYAVTETEAVPVATPEPVNDAPWFLAATNRIDYLIVVSRALEATVQELAAYREGQGLRVGVATFEDLCDWLAGGIRTPEAVPALLAHAAETWTEAPWMVLLAGNGHYDFLGALSSEVNHIPPLLLQTLDGIFAADNLMADVDGDGLPDIAIGRLPAITEADLAAMIAKIQAYEAGFGQIWQDKLVLASDTNDGAGDFAATAQRVAALTTGRRPTVDTIDLNQIAITPARNKLNSYFNSGAGFIHYTGHGGVANWSGQGLLKATDISTMHNITRPPAVVALSCLVGRYEVPGVNSLGELLLRKAGGGAVAAWGPSGLSRNNPAADLGEFFYRQVIEEQCGSLGLAVLRAVRGLDGDLVSRDTLAVYNLLGDPALRIAGNLGAHPSGRTFTEWRWQRFSPAELADPEASAAPGIFAEYAHGRDEPVLAERPEFGFPLPEDEEPGFVLRWKRRVRRGDVDYRLFVSGDLHGDWQPADAAGFEELGSEPDPDGVMETVRTRVDLPPANRVFIGIKAERK